MPFRVRQPARLEKAPYQAKTPHLDGYEPCRGIETLEVGNVAGQDQVPVLAGYQDDRCVNHVRLGGRAAQLAASLGKRQVERDDRDFGAG